MVNATVAEPSHPSCSSCSYGIQESASPSAFPTVTVNPVQVSPQGEVSSSTVITDSSANTIITTYDSSGNMLAQVTLPPESKTATGTVSVSFTTMGTNTVFQMTGVNASYPPGKSVMVSADPSSDSVCIVDGPGPTTLTAGSLIGCATDTSISKVFLHCDGTSTDLTGFPDSPATRSYACSKLVSIGGTFLKVDGLAFSLVATTSAARVEISKFFTDGDLHPLANDRNGNPKVDVVLANRRVRGTNPGQLLDWVNMTNTGSVPLESVRLNETLPVDWTISPAWMLSSGAIHVFFVYANGTRQEITDPGTVTVSAGNPQRVSLHISSISTNAAGKPLSPGESILLSVKTEYALKGTSQLARSYPRNYTDSASVSSFTGSSFGGNSATRSVSGVFIAYARVLGDVNGDFRVDIRDAATAATAYLSRLGDASWNADADFDNNGVINILDMAVVAYYYGTSS